MQLLKSIAAALISLILVAGCRAPTTSLPKPTQTNLGHIVSAAGVDKSNSTLLIARLSDGTQWVSNLERSLERYAPASTSKIPHTLIALETGFAQAQTPFKWDGTDRGFSFWNQDQTLSSAYARSAVWVYQTIISSLGHEVMSEWLAKFGYGNMNIGTTENLTNYWLVGPLEISASEQIDFLRRLVKNELPVSSATITQAREIMTSDSQPGWRMYSKTGWRMNDHGTDIGWFVGWVDIGSDGTSDTYIFAFNLDMDKDSDRAKRKNTVYAALTEIGAISN